MLFLSAAEVESLLDPDAAIASQRRAFAALARGAVDLPHKIMHPSGFDDSVVFCYAARMSGDTGAVAKVGSINPGNPARGLASIHALVIAFDPVTGQPVAAMDGGAVTTLRTAAGSAVAVDLLAVPAAATLAVIGSGVQAKAHVRAISRVRELADVRIWSPSDRRVATAAELDARAVDSAEEAVAGADIVVTCTLSREPVVRGAWLSPGATVVSVGSFEPSRREVDEDLVRRAAAVVVDDPETAAGHAGPIIGVVAKADLVALGDVVTGLRSPRTSPDDVIFYNSTGIGVQDAAAAWAIIDTQTPAH
ncbi:ornithine cyclodeaminase family protein [Kutzneria sp. CA-103260]|uniref:ornithine cyclodeaminase family protein n=1 Tax=Kutzneria sp. CA-103260 TaxID=2802641 RepID=UPI001BA4C14A|nr:ornithine cyclodeaminase family protein [Kutzneria sp. CA-103260]QUQ66526.1 ornithine cyclodeaminase family protein [Kutzneria sp. CA-103260]